MKVRSLEEFFFPNDSTHIMILENHHKFGNGHNEKFQDTNFPKKLTHLFIL